jgi:hypothetical protein
MEKRQWRTIAFTPDTAGWEALYKNDDGSFLRVPIAGWLLQEETRVDSFGRYTETLEDSLRETRVVAGDEAEGTVEPCSNSTNFHCLVPRNPRATPNVTPE